MELGQLDNTPHHDTSTGHLSGLLSLVLYAFSWIAFWLQANTADMIWTWIWRGLSLISLILIIYINWNKAKEIFTGKKNEHKL